MSAPAASPEPPAPPGPPRAPRWAVWTLLATLILTLWWRGHTVGPTVCNLTGLRLWPVVVGQSEPLDCDEAIYATIGRQITEGAVMYRDLTENKPPLGYWLYALAVAVGGAEELTIRLMPLPFVLATVALVWWIALRLRGPGAACLAAGLFALLSTDPYLFGNGANMEHFINLFATASLALMVWALGRGRNSGLVGAGACVGAATLVKPVAALHGLVYAAFVAFGRAVPGAAIARPLVRRVVGLAALALGFVLVLGAAVAILAAQGALGAAYEDAVRYGSALATDVPADPDAPPFLVRLVTGNADPAGRLPWPFGTTDYLVWWGAGAWPLWLAGLPALGWLLLGRDPRAATVVDNSRTSARRLVAAWTVSAWVQVALPGLFWPHYYLLPAPGVAVAVAVLFTDALEAAQQRARRPGWRVLGLLATLVTTTAIVGTAAIQVRDYLLVPPEQLTVRFKGGGQWVFLRELGRELGRRAPACDDPHLYVWGIQSPLYFYAGLDPVTPQVFADNLILEYAEEDHSLIKPRIARTMRDLRARRPALIFCGYPPFAPLRAFLREQYVPARLQLSGQPLSFPGGLGLWVRTDCAAAFEREPFSIEEVSRKGAKDAKSDRTSQSG